MTSTTTLVFLFAGVVALIAGMILGCHALSRYGSASAPSAMSLNPAAWRPVWKTRHWFTEDRGFHLHCASAALMSLGGLAVLLGILMGSGVF